VISHPNSTGNQDKAQIMKTEALLIDVKAYVEGLFLANMNPSLIYHNLDHTRQVVLHTEEIAVHYSLGENTLFALLTAAWFHDTGQLFGDMVGHEELGVQIMQGYLHNKVDANTLNEAARCIMATKMPPKPLTLTEMILCDADTYHLGTPEFRKMDDLVWQELELRLKKKYNNKIALSLRFLQTHTFYTEYCRQLLDEGKRKNIEQLKALQ
jgi:hypothetical protein